MKPGVSATDAVADDRITSDEVLATGTSDGKGYYQSEAAIPLGQTYSVVVIARGYRPIVSRRRGADPSRCRQPVPSRCYAAPERLMMSQ